MADLATHRTSELPPDARAVLEQLLGRRLADDESVRIQALHPHPALTGEARAEGWRKLNEHMDQMAAKAEGAVEEVERTIDTVCDEVRHGPG